MKNLDSNQNTQVNYDTLTWNMLQSLKELCTVCSNIEYVHWLTLVKTAMIIMQSVGVLTEKDRMVI